MGYVKKIVTVLLVLIPLTAIAAEERGNADQFWLKYRKAILSNRTKEISDMTRFPFEVRGIVDTDPVKYYDRKRFPPILTRILIQRQILPSGGRFIEKTMLQVVEEKRGLVPQDYLTPEFLRVEQLEFQRIRGHWLFTGAYLEE